MTHGDDGGGHQHSAVNEHTPLIPPAVEQLGRQRSRRGSVVSYTFSNRKCANVTGKDALATRSTKRKLFFATTLALLFFAGELAAGYFANSLGKQRM